MHFIEKMDLWRKGGEGWISRNLSQPIYICESNFFPSVTFGKVDVILNGRFALKVPQIAHGKETAVLESWFVICFNSPLIRQHHRVEPQMKSFLLHLLDAPSLKGMTSVHWSKTTRTACCGWSTSSSHSPPPNWVWDNWLRQMSHCRFSWPSKSHKLELCFCMQLLMEK